MTMTMNLNLYDMSRVNSNYRGYYMNKDGEIYSSKSGSGNLVRLHGSNTSSGRYYTLNGRTYRHDALKDQFMHRHDFIQEVHKPLQNVANTVTLGSARAHAASTEVGVSAKGFIIGRIQGNSIVLGSQPKIHVTLHSVNSEMERLANAHPGVKFVRLKIDGSVVAGGIKWE